jgi:SagB-type dehydrogenase family enzyme
VSARGGGDESSVITAAVYANSFRTLQPTTSATGLRTWLLRHESAGACDGTSHIAEDFLVASRLRRHDIDFEMSVGAHLTEVSTMMHKLSEVPRRRSSTTGDLPTPLPVPLPVDRAMELRRSTRTFTGDPMPLSHLATLAATTAGRRTGASAEGKGPSSRVCASAGALYPVDLWFAALAVTGLERGVYEYDSVTHRLDRRCGSASVDSLLRAVAAPEEVIMTSRAAVLCLLVARPWRGMRKYGPRGLRHVFLEAGGMAAHLGLVVAAMGWGGVECSSVYDDEAHAALGIDGVYEALAHAVVLGAPA